MTNLVMVMPYQAYIRKAQAEGFRIHAIWDPPPGGPAPTAYRLDVTGSFTGSFSTAGRTLSGTAGPGSYKLDLVSVNPCGASGTTASYVITVP